MSDQPPARPEPAPDPPERATPSALAYRGSIAALVLGSFVALFLVLRPPADESRADLARPQPTTATSAPSPTTPTPATPTPTPATPVPTATAAPASTPTPATSIEYTIVDGDTLSGIAESFGVTVEGIIELNPELDPDTIQIGQIILVPRP